MLRRDPPPPWPRALEAALVVGFWAVLGALALVRRALDPRGPEGLATPGLVITLAEYGLWAALTPAVFLLTRRLRLDAHRLWRVLLYAAAAFAVAVFVEWMRQALVGVFFPEILERRLQRGPFGRGPRRPEPGLEGIVTRLRFLDELVIAVAVIVAGFARDALVRLRERETHAAHLEAQLADARLAALRMQLNPHFLFNTLHAVSALVEHDPAGVRTVIARLSALLRRVLDRTDRHEVPLKEEVALVRDYLAIQEVRLGDRLRVAWAVAPEAESALVPALVLQPLAENAVGHGVARAEGGGTVTVEAAREGADLVLRVRDTGPGADAGHGAGQGADPAAHPAGASGEPRALGASGAGVGLANTRQRLAALYGDAARLTLAPEPTGGAVATVRLPFHTAADVLRA